jgi:hypothetical protein
VTLIESNEGRPSDATLVEKQVDHHSVHVLGGLAAPRDRPPVRTHLQQGFLRQVLGVVLCAREQVCPAQQLWQLLASEELDV